MTPPKHVIFIAAAIFFLLTGTAAQAHRMRVFAYESGGTIHVEAEFGSGRPAKGVAVIVRDEGGSELLTGSTDENGKFRFSLPPAALATPVDLEIIAAAGEGHRGSWLLEAEEYAAAPAATKNDPASETPPPPAAPRAASTAAELPESCRKVDELIRTSIAAELAPVKKMLAEQRRRSLTLQDILGGLGYIFGIAGIAAYFQAKRNQQHGGSK